MSLKIFLVMSFTRVGLCKNTPPKAIRGTNHNHDAPQPSKNKAKTTNHAHNGAEKYANPSITMWLLILQIHFYP